MHKEIAEITLYIDIKLVNNCLEQFVQYKPVFTFVYIDFELRRESDTLWWFHAPGLYPNTACGGIKLVSVPEGTLLRAVDFANGICGVALDSYVHRMEIWFYRFGLLRPKVKGQPSTLKKADSIKVSTEHILQRLDEIHLDLGGKLNSETQIVIDIISKQLQQQSIEQGEIQRKLDAIRRALKYVLKKGLPLADEDAKKLLLEIQQLLNSDLDARQQLELSLPVIPFLLQYKIQVDAGVDLKAVWNELVEKIQGSQV